MSESRLLTGYVERAEERFSSSPNRKRQRVRAVNIDLIINIVTALSSSCLASDQYVRKSGLFT